MQPVLKFLPRFQVSCLGSSIFPFLLCIRLIKAWLAGLVQKEEIRTEIEAAVATNLLKRSRRRFLRNHAIRTRAHAHMRESNALA